MTALRDVGFRWLDQATVMNHLTYDFIYFILICLYMMTFYGMLFFGSIFSTNAKHQTLNIEQHWCVMMSVALECERHNWLKGEYVERICLLKRYSRFSSCSVHIVNGCKDISCICLFVVCWTKFCRAFGWQTVISLK